MRLSLGKASPWKIHPDTTAEKNGRRQRDHMHVKKTVGNWKMLISMCFSVDSSSPNGGDHPQKVGFDDYGMPIPSASAVSKLTTQQWRSMRKSTRDHVFDVPCSCRKQMLVLCQSQSCYPFSRDSWYDNDNHDDNEEAHNFHVRKSLIIQMETTTNFYIALFFSSCTFQTEKKISKTCTLSLFTLFRILLSIAPYAHFPSWMLVYYWRSTISIMHHKFWQDFESHVFCTNCWCDSGSFPISLQYSNESA